MSQLGEKISGNFVKSLISGIVTSFFMLIFISKSSQSLFAGLCIGFTAYMLIFIYKSWFEKVILVRTSLLIVFILGTFLQTIIILAVIIIFVGIFYLKGNFGIYLSNTSVLLNPPYIIGLVFGLILSSFFTSLSIISRLLGRKLFFGLIVGNYRKPMEEERIFMFLDINSSTAIAEKTGHLLYLSLLNDFFHDIAGPISKTKGEIYKYVGDEAIITWKIKEGIKNSNCLHCFFQIDRVLKNKSGFYLKKYGIVPDFKAALHAGITVSGEIGFLKKEIGFAGDVINTTARIEKQCNILGQRLLLSEDLVRYLKLTDEAELFEVGNFLLKGKKQQIKLYGYKHVL